MKVDVHTHLTHEKFADDVDAVIARAVDAGVGAIISNGLDPRSNDDVLALAARHSVVKPALGIYPIDAVNDLLPDDFQLPTPRFDVQAEIARIRTRAEQNAIVAVGECGLDGYWLGPETFAAQEKVFEALIDIAIGTDLPIIVHSRKLEARTIEILAHHRVKNVVMHCFGGKVKQALRAAHDFGFRFSIPANASKNEAFRKMLELLPRDLILTETDAPYLGPIPGARNEPCNVATTVNLFAQLRGLSGEEAEAQIEQNYRVAFKQPF